MERIKKFFKVMVDAVNPFISRSRSADARFEVLSAILSRMGYRLYNRGCMWPLDKEYMDVWKQYPEHNNKIHDRRFNLYNLAKAVRGLEGDTAECGVYRGGGSFLILSALMTERGTHHIFDSFEGLSEPDSSDIPSQESITAWKEGDLSAPCSNLELNLARFSERISIHPGWIPDRFEDVKNHRFKLVHIDVDLYQPTLDSLEFFYPRMVRGGLIICDDYGYHTCPGAYRAMEEFFSKNGRESIIHLTSGTGFIVKF